MKARVLDASVALAWYLPERFTPAARRWREALLDGKVRLLAPSLHYFEVANVLRTYVRRKELEPGLAHEIYETHLEAPIDLVEPSRAEILRLALEHDATSYDAVYIALAMEHQAPLLTAERTTTPWVVSLKDLVEPLS